MCILSRIIFFVYQIPCLFQFYTVFFDHMQTFLYTREQLVNGAKFSDRDVEEIKRCRRDYNRLGFGYQLACVRLLNRLPIGYPLEVIDDLLAYVSAQLNIPNQAIDLYAKWQKTVFEHQERIKLYLGHGTEST